MSERNKKNFLLFSLFLDTNEAPKDENRLTGDQVDPEGRVHRGRRRELREARARLGQQPAEERAATERGGRGGGRDCPAEKADGEDEGVLAEPGVGAAGGGAAR